MPSPINNAGLFLVQSLFDLYIYILLLRLLLQAGHANYHNPVSQVIIKLTQPLVKPLQRFIPGYKGIDFAIVVLVLVVDFIKLVLVAWLAIKVFPNLFGISIWTLGDLLNKIINVYFYGVIVRVVLSWIPSTQHHPVTHVLVLLTEPIMQPARRLIPSISGIDLSPILVLIVLKMISILLFMPVISMGAKLAVA